MQIRDDAAVDHEALYRLVYEQRWGEALHVLYAGRAAVVDDPLLARAAATCVEALFTALAAGPDAAYSEELERLFLLHTGGFYRLSSDRFAEVTGRLVDLHADRPEAALGYARFCPDAPRCAAVLARHAAAQPVPIPQAGRSGLDLSANRPDPGAVHTIPLFKSQQETTFFRAVREVFPTYLVYPNVALSCLVDFEAVRPHLDAAARRYFFRGVVDCVVFDQHDAYRPRYFFELDSDHHDAPERQARDRWKEQILAVAGCLLYRVRPRAAAVDQVAYVDLLRSLTTRADR
jgi:hypothetical protein